MTRAPASPRNLVVATILVLLALVPVYAQARGNPYLLSLFTRIVILAMAGAPPALAALVAGLAGFSLRGAAISRGIKLPAYDR